MKCVVYWCPLCQQRLLLTITDNLCAPTEPACARCGHGMVAQVPIRRPATASRPGAAAVAP